MMKLSGKRLFSLLLAIFMVITMLPPNIVFAEDDIPVEEPSTPVCTGLEDCAAEIHEDGCPKKPAAEPAEDEEPTKPLCTGLEDCAAEIHEDGCPKKPADEPVKDDEPTKPLCTGLADCPAETHGEACEKKLADEKAAADKAAADAVAALIEALPTLEAVQAMPQEELPAAYEQVMKAHDAYKALTGDQKALLSIDETFFDGYLSYFAALTQPAADHSHTICGKTSCSCGSSHGSAVWQSLPSGTTKLTGGNYYLDGDVTLSSILTVSGDVSLCLNGHTLTTTAGKIYISSGCLTICDCIGGGRITGASTSWSVIDLVDSGSLTVYSGTIAATDSSGTAISAITTGDIQIRGGTVSAGRLALSISKVNDLTITSGSITSTSGYGISISQSFHDMKISGGTIKGFENGIHFGAFTCSGIVSISGGTIEATGTNVNAGGYASRLYGIGFSTGNAGTCYVYITGGTVKGAKGGIYNFKPNLTMNISGGTLGTSGTIGIAADRGTVNINGGKVYSVDCGGPATITVTNGEVYCVYLTAGAGSTGAGKLIVTGGTVGRVGSATSTYGIGNPLYNPTGTISVEISGGTIVGSSYALYSVSQFSAKISGGTFSGATADIYMGEAPASFSTAYISMDGYSGDPLTFSLGTTVKPVAYLARQVANSSLITLVDSTYSLNYDSASKSVILTDIHTHSFNSTTHKCSCGAIGGYCGDPSVNSGKNVSWVLEGGVLTVYGSGAMENFLFKGAPWFSYASQITKIIIDYGVTNISEYAFYGCTKAASVSIASSVTGIDKYAFHNCSSLTAIDIPASVTFTGFQAFKFCTNLETVTLHEGITTLGYGTFEECAKLKTINLPNSLTSIGKYVFYNCSSLTSIEIPESITSISKGMFHKCSGLKQIVIPSGVTVIDDSAFSSCTALTTITLPKALTTVIANAFWGCTGLTTVNYVGCEALWDEISIASGNDPLTGATVNYSCLCTSGHDYVDGTCTRCGGEEPGIGGYCGDPSVNGGKNVTWSLEDGKLTISGSGAMANYSYSTKAPWDAYKDDITSIAVENGVTTVGDYAFYNLGEVTSATLADSVTTIGSSAFYLCSSMASIKMSAGLTSIGSSAFWRAGLTSIDIPAGVTSIGAGALQIFPLTSINVASGNTAYSSQDGVLFNKNKTTLIAYPLGKAGEYFMPDSVTRIEESAFAFASGLSMVKLSAGLTSVNSSAFSQCTGLFTVVVPEGITAFFDFAFNGCPSLTVYYGGTEAQWKNIRFNSYNNSIQSPRKIYYRAMGTTGDVSYLFYNGTLTVYGNGDMADYEAQGAPWFPYYTEITKIVVEDGVTSIGDYAFDRCERASSITLSKDLTSIGEGAFQDCTSVTAMTIPAGVTSIGDKAFRHCTAMKTLTFTDNAPTMGDAFYNIPNLTVYYPAGDSSWDSVAGKNYGNQYPVTWIATCGETHDFENGVISYIWTSNYSSCTAALTCGNSGCMVSGSGNGKTVKSTSSREEATCSKPGKTVYTAVFSAPYETQTKEVPIPATGEHNYSKEVASAAFRVSAATCQSPAVYKKSCACGAASDTETFTYGEAGEHTRDENHKCTVCGHIGGFCGISSQNNGKDLCWTLKDGVLTISGTGAMADYASASEPWYIYRNVITSAVVGEGVTTLGQAAFDECEKLVTVELPSTLTVIGKWAFSGCADLTAIDIPDSVHTIGAAAFGHCDMLTSVTIPAKVTEILGSTFYTCDRLETVTLLGNITTIGDSAFGYCYKLKNFTIPSTVTSIGKYAFRSCWGLTEVTIPAGVTVVNYGTFHDCKNLVSVKLPNGLTKIDESAFESCGKLAEINLPSTLTTVGPQAFASCKQLESLVLPDSVTGIGKYAFSGCEKLTSVILSKNLASIPEGAFNFCPITEIEIPASVASIATKAFGYCRSLTEITFLGNAPTFGADAFKEVANATALYPRTGTGWAEAVKSTYGGTVTWKMYCPNGQHSFEEIVDEAHLVSEATCAQGAVYKKLCPCGEVSATETFIYGEAGDHTWDKNHKCTVCGQIGGFCGIGSQNNGKDICWTLKDGVLTVSGTGAMDNYNTVTYKAPWDAYASEIVSVVVENGITSIGDSAFFRCGSLESVSIADTVTGIGSSAFSYCKELTDLKLPAGLLKIGNDAFSNCEKLESVEIPAGVTSIGSVAFLNCEALTSVVIPGSVSSIGQAAFSSCTALEDAYYAGTKANWDEISIGSDNNRLLDTRIHYNCTNPAQHWTTHNTEATCSEAGYSVEVCACPTPYNRNKVETDGALGHDMGQWLPDPDKEGEERSDCSRCDHYETRPSGPVILLGDAELQNQTTVWIDGAPYPVVTDPDQKIVRVPENSNIKEGSALVTYEYHTGTAGDVHTQYPTGMKVWILSQQEDGNFTATRVSEFDNLLQYSGCSIRIVGVKGIRMITSINQSTKKALTGAGLSGYTLVEYGTALCRASALGDGQPMTLENPNVKSNYAYKKGVADPVFKYSGNLVQYTNVLVGFTDDDCKEDIAMRPYIILQNESGDTVTIYGGIIYRSIGYIAYQNRNAFAVGSDAYEYVWSIIHHVYGDEFDADYKS